MAENPTHVRLPQRAEAVAGPQPPPGKTPPPAPIVPDPRTVTQDPVEKKRKDGSLLP